LWLGVGFTHPKSREGSFKIFRNKSNWIESVSVFELAVNQPGLLVTVLDTGFPESFKHGWASSKNGHELASSGAQRLGHLAVLFLKPSI
jgi:hypothetical protein